MLVVRWDIGVTNRKRESENEWGGGVLGRERRGVKGRERRRGD